MILKCTNPAGKVCTVRVKANAVIPLITSLARHNFFDFALVPEYRKFHRLHYVQLMVALNHFARGLNKHLNGGTNLLIGSSRQAFIDSLIDESLETGNLALLPMKGRASYGGSC